MAVKLTGDFRVGNLPLSFW